MMRRMFFQRGQSLVDFALILGVVGLVFIGMQTYIKRGVQGRVKAMTDHILSGDQAGVEDAQAQTSSLESSSTMTSLGYKEGRKSLIGEEHSTYNYTIGEAPKEED